tara:strand:- start:5251 stop:6654 length:1404 start_codon:yes stop_codon:yes gene_type:complete
MSKKESNACKALLKDVPSIDELYRILNIKSIQYPREIIKKILRKTLNLIRKDIQSGIIEKNIRKISIDRTREKLNKIVSFNLNNIINGTGIVLHTGLGRAPLSKKIVEESFERIYPYSNLEFNVEDNLRGDRNTSIQDIINPLMGTQSAIVVNNCAAAVLLSLNTFCDNKETIISRGQQVEIGGSFRIPEVVLKSGSIIKDVGTTNKTHPIDYQNAINKNTGAILYAHTSNYRVVGFTNEIQVVDLSKVAKKNKIPLIVDAGSGCLAVFKKFNMPSESTIKEYINKGADIVMFSGDKLLGGPQCGIIAGKKKYIDMIKKNPLYRVFRVDKLTFSLLESTLRTYTTESEFGDKNLSLHLLTRNRDSLNDMGHKILMKISPNIIKKYNLGLINTMVEAGSGSMPINSLQSVGIAFNSKSIKPNKLSKKFRSASTPIIGYINNNQYVIDLKAIPLDCIKDVSKIISEVLK